MHHMTTDTMHAGAWDAEVLEPLVLMHTHTNRKQQAYCAAETLSGLENA